jgi:hypothetical protein
MTVFSNVDRGAMYIGTRTSIGFFRGVLLVLLSLFLNVSVKLQLDQKFLKLRLNLRTDTQYDSQLCLTAQSRGPIVRLVHYS